MLRQIHPSVGQYSLSGVWRAPDIACPTRTTVVAFFNSGLIVFGHAHRQFVERDSVRRTLRSAFAKIAKQCEAFSHCAASADSTNVISPRTRSPENAGDGSKNAATSSGEKPYLLASPDVLTCTDTSRPRRSAFSLRSSASATRFPLLVCKRPVVADGGCRENRDVEKRLTPYRICRLAKQING